MATKTIETYTDGVLVATQVVEVPPEQTNQDDLNAKARAALAVNATFLALANPNNAQVAAQVERLTRECSALIRLLLDELDDTAGT